MGERPRILICAAAVAAIATSALLAVGLARSFSHERFAKLSIHSDAVANHLSRNVLAGNTLGLAHGLGLVNSHLKKVLQGQKSELDHLHTGLERVRKMCGASIIYAMDKKGDVLASTRYADNKTLMGNNYAFRPYFQKAIRGQGNVFIAVGVTTKKRGIYYAAPVMQCAYKNKNPKVMGVVVIKMGFERIDSFMAEVRGAKVCFVSHDGEIFSSNVDGWLYQKLSDVTSSAGNCYQAVFTGNLVDIDGALYGTHRSALRAGDCPWGVIMFEPVSPWFPRGQFAILGAVCVLLWAAIAIAIYLAARRRLAEHEARKALEQSSETYQAIFNSSNDAIFIHELRTGNVLDLNREFETMYGYTIAEGKKVDFSAFCEGVDPFTVEEARRRIRKAGEEGELTFDWRTKHRNGDVFWVEVHLRKVHIAGDDRVLATVRDISERKAHEEELHKYNQELQNLYQELKANQGQLLRAERMAGLGQLAAGMAHEVNNPIGFVKSNLNTLGDYAHVFEGLIALYDKLDAAIAAADLDAQSVAKCEIDRFRKDEDLDFLLEDIGQLLRDSNDGVERVAAIVANLRKFARLDESGSQMVDVNECLKAAANVLEAKTSNTAISLELAELPGIHANAASVNQLFMELLKNAVESGSPEINAATGLADDKIVCTVSDTGKGIADEDLNKLYDPFFTTKDVGKGTGMGLAVVYGIVAELDGTVDIKSRLGEGTTVTITLPFEQAADDGDATAEVDDTIEAIMKDMTCPKNFKCAANGFKDLCKARDISQEGSLECLDENCENCPFAASEDGGYRCHCHLRVYLGKMQAKNENRTTSSRDDVAQCEEP